MAEGKQQGPSSEQVDYAKSIRDMMAEMSQIGSKLEKSFTTQATAMEKMADAMKEMGTGETVAQLNQLNETLKLVSDTLLKMQNTSAAAFSDMGTKAAAATVATNSVASAVEDLGSRVDEINSEPVRNLTKDLKKNAEQGEKSKKSFSSLDEFLKSKWPKTIGIAGGALSGFIQGITNMVAMTKSVSDFFTSFIGGIFSVGRSIVAIPFNMLKGLIDMADQGGNEISELAQSTNEMRKEFGSLSGPTNKAIASTAAAMGNLHLAGTSAFAVFGNLAERQKLLTELYAQSGPALRSFAGEIEKSGGAIIAYQKGLGLSNEQMETMGQVARTQGKSMEKVLNEVHKQADGLGKAFGLDAKIISKEIGKAAADFKNFGNVSIKEMGVAVAYAQKLGVSLDKITGVMDSFDTFDNAAENVSKLNEAFHTNVDMGQIMEAQSPQEKLELLRKEFKKAGIEGEKLTYAQRKLISQTTGLSDEVSSAAFSSKNYGTSLADIKKQSEKSEQKTVSQADAMNKLADAMERNLKAGQAVAGGDGLFGALTKGLTDGIQRTQEFMKMMFAIKGSIRQVYMMGLQMGQMFVKMFPGIKDILGGIADLFDPKRFGALSNGVMKIFKDFNSGSIKSFDELMEKLRQVFFNFFEESKGPSKKILDGFKKFGEAVIKIMSGLIKWAADKLADLIQNVIDFVKNPKIPSTGGAGGFFKVFEPLLNSLMYAFEKLAPLMEKLLLSLAQLALQIITSEKFLSFMKKAGPVIALVLFGPAFMQAVMGAMTASLAAAATGAIKDAFLGPGSKKISEMSGKQFAKLMQDATPPPMPATAGGPIIPPGTPSPQEAAQAQATGAVIDSALIIKLLLALAAIITIGLVAFYAASQIAKSMNREQIENTLLVLAGMAIAVLPAAAALVALSGIPSAGLLGAIPALLALAVVVPGMGALGILLADMAKDTSFENILKAILITAGMATALIPAAVALAEMAAVGSVVSSGAPMILLALLALGVLVPAMAYLGIQLADMASSVSIQGILKAILITTGMATALLIASVALAELAAVGALTPLVPLILLGVAAVGLTTFAMFEIAPMLAAAAGKINIGKIGKAMTILAMMALAIVEVIPTMVLLAVAGILSVIGPLIETGIQNFAFVSQSMLGIAPLLQTAAQQIKLSQLTRALVALALMAVAIAETIPSMVLLAEAGALALLVIPIIAGLAAVKLISLELLKFAPELGKASQGIKIDPIVTSLTVMGLMSAAIADSVLNMVLLATAGELTMLLPVILIGVIAVAAISKGMFAAAKIMSKASDGVEIDKVQKSLLIVGLMSLSIVQAIANMVLLTAAGVLSVLGKVIDSGIEIFRNISIGLLVSANDIVKAMDKVEVSSIFKAMGAIGSMTLAVLETLVGMIALAALGALIPVYPISKLGLKVMKWTVENLAEASADISKNAQIIKDSKLETYVPSLEAVFRALGSIGSLLPALVTLGLMKSLGFDVPGAIDNLSKLIKDITPSVVAIVGKLSEFPSSEGLKDKVDAFGGVIKAIGELSNTIGGAIKNLDFGWLDSAKDKAQLMNKLKEFMSEFIGKPGGGGIIGLVDVVIKGIESISASDEVLNAAKTMAELLGSIGKLAEVMRPDPEFFKAVAAADDDDVKSTMTEGLTGLKELMSGASSNIQNILSVVASQLLPAIKLFNPAQLEQVSNLAPVIEAIAKIVGAMQPPKELFDILKDAIKNDESTFNIFEGMSQFFNSLSPVIGSLIGSLSSNIPTLVSKINEMKITPEQVDALAAIAPLIGSLATLVGNLTGPAAALMNATRGGGGIFDDPKDFGKQIEEIKQVMKVMQDSLMDMIGPNGPLVGLIKLLSSNDIASRAEEASKFAPIITVVGDIIKSMTPSSEMLKIINEAAKDPKKMEELLKGIGSVVGVLSSNISPVTTAISSLIGSIGSVSITPDQVELLKVLGPIISSVTKLTTDLIQSVMKGGKPPTAEGVATLKTFMDNTVSSIGQVFDSMSSNVGKIIDNVSKKIIEMKGKGVPADQLKSGVEAFKSAFEMIATVQGAMKDISAMGTKKDEKGVASFDPNMIRQLMDSFGQLVDAIFSSGVLNRIVIGLNGVSGDFAKQKDKIDSLKSAFDLITTITSLVDKFTDKKGGNKKLTIKPQDIADQIGQLAEVVNLSVQKLEEHKIIESIKKMTGLGKAKDDITNIDQSFKNLANLSKTIEDSKDKLPKTEAADQHPAVIGLKNMGGLLKSMAEAAGPVGQNAASLLNKLKSLANIQDVKLAEGFNNVQRMVNSIIESKFVKDAASSTTALDNVKDTVANGMVPAIKAVNDMIASAQQLEKSLAAGTKIDVPAKLKIFASQFGKNLGAAGAYTVQAKDVNLTVNFRVAIDAKELEGIMVSHGQSVIRNRINMLLTAVQDTTEGKAAKDKASSAIVTAGNSTPILTGNYG